MQRDSDNGLKQCLEFNRKEHIKAALDNIGVLSYLVSLVESSLSKKILRYTTGKGPEPFIKAGIQKG